MHIPMPPLAAALAAVWLLSPIAAGAQTQTSPPAAPSAAMPAAPGQGAKVSDQKITQAAAAMSKVMTLRQSYQQRLAQATPGDRGRIAQEGQAAMKQAVTDQGLSVPEYNSILQTAQNDPAVRQKLLSRLQPASGGTPGGPSNQ
ncbi:MAG: DUF4168 domain-containing protein [Alphaproteobacteria bacterium]|nr:DUF4168 domain-containing protein [Alphaproteobacteria bacterium]